MGNIASSSAESADIHSPNGFSTRTHRSHQYHRTLLFHATETQTKYLRVFSTQSIESKIAKLKNGLPGPDGISPLFLKKCSKHVVYPVSQIMKKAFLESKLRSAWKTASVTPILKKK
ncbi:hypothetical protein HHI36_013324 [Cryptolaemus montrouzieri]|uniref:Uncharacterized protein n=1 Tax=Cryptolaemus montrouzieri TaxID=559131 RepID=A0ABD2NHU0_9CUCU